MSLSASALYDLKPRFQNLLDTPAEWLAERDTNPDVLTFAGVAAALVGGAALAAGALGQQPLLWLVPAMALARLTFNALDGMVAVRTGRARAWGKVLNELCDRLADLAFLVPLCLVPNINQPLVAAAIATTLLVSYLGVLSEAAGARREYGGVLGKADRMVWLGLAAGVAAADGDQILLRLLPALLLVGGLVTLVQRARRIHAAL
ncbi:MAG TPA: CDP-alcohol phosphatidyltransferase family protein [Chloroflexota bacterium]